MSSFHKALLFLALPLTVVADSRIGNSHLELSADMTSNLLKIKDAQTHRVWVARFDECAGSSGFDDWQHIVRPRYGKFTLRKAETTSSSTMTLTIMDEQNDRVYFLDAELKGNAVSFELYADTLDLPITCVGLPPLFTTEMEEGHLVFCDRSCGVLKSQSDFEGYAGDILSTYANTSCLDMPWVGVVDLKKGDGMLVLLETPLDSAMHLRTVGDRIWPQPLWQGRMGKMGYRRRISYRFSDHGGYAALAGIYRDYQKANGKLKTLAQKSAERPKVARLAGAPPIWGDGDVFEFLHDARNLGVTKAVLGNAERGGRTREDMDRLDRMGYLTLRYDSYSDVEDGETWFQRDDVEKTAYRLHPGGDPLKGWRTMEGLQFYSRSSAFALRAAKTYSKELMLDFGLNANFIDVMGAIDLVEDYHPEHTFDREQDMRFKRETFKFYGDNNMVVGTEHGNDWMIDLVDYTEGSLSGSFWWVPGANTNGWNPGHLQRPVSLDDFSSLYLKYGVDTTNRIPLWQLVYHDCATSTWYWGDSAGWFNQVAPEITDQKDLMTLLYGALPLFWRDTYRGYDWSQHKARWMESYYLTVKFHEAVFGQQMTVHEFVSADRLVQKTEFENGAAVWVNFGSGTYRLELDGRELLLPPNGFYAKAPDMEQGRIMEGGLVKTFVKAKDFFYYQSKKKDPAEELSVEGELVLFRLEEDHWNLLFRPELSKAAIDTVKLGKFIGWSDFEVCALSKNWKMDSGIWVGEKAGMPLRGGAYALVKPAATSEENEQ